MRIICLLKQNSINKTNGTRVDQFIIDFLCHSSGIYYETKQSIFYFRLLFIHYIYTYSDFINGDCITEILLSNINNNIYYKKIQQY